MENKNVTSVQNSVITKEKLEEDSKKEVKEVLNKDLSQKNDKYDFGTKKVSQKGVVFLFFIGIVLAAVPVCLKFVTIPYFSKRIVESITVLIFCIMTTLFFVFAIYRAIGNFLLRFEDNIFIYIYLKNGVPIKIFICFILIYSFIDIFFPGIEKKMVENSTTESAFSAKIPEYGRNLLYAVWMVALVFVMRNVFLQSIEYRIHKKFFRKRIEENEKIIKSLKNLNKIAGGEVYSDISKWASHVFSCLTHKSGKDVLSKDDFLKFYGNDEGKKIFDLFDVNFDNKISEEEFVNRYVALFQERKNLQKALYQNDGSIRKLNSLSNIIVFPLAIFFVATAFTPKEEIVLRFGFLGGLFFTFNFAFSGTLSKMFGCMIFVYFVRPFDVGDMIMIDNKLLKVVSFGFINSNFLEGNVLHSMSNAETKNKDISNFRNLGFKTEKILKKYKYSAVINNLEIYKNRISQFINSNRNKFLTEFSVYEFEITGDEIKFTVEISILCKYQDLKAMYKNKDNFAIFLHDLSEELFNNKKLKTGRNE